MINILLETIRSNAYPELDGLKLEGKIYWKSPRLIDFCQILRDIKNIVRGVTMLELRFTGGIKMALNPKS